MFGVTSAELAAMSSGVSNAPISSIFPAQLNPVTSNASEVAIYSLIDELFLSVSEIKVALEQLLLKVDSCGTSNASPNVSSFLDSLSVVSGQMHMLCRKLSTLNPNVIPAPNAANRSVRPK